jgi:hypothetical protein
MGHRTTAKVNDWKQMSWSEPESGGLVLRVDQKKWSVFKTDKQKKMKKKWNEIKKCFYTKNTAFLNFAKRWGDEDICPLPPAHMSLIRKDIWTLTFSIFIQFFHLLFLWLSNKHFLTMMCSQGTRNALVFPYFG